MDFKAAKRMDRFSHYAVAASKEALEDSGLDLSKEDAFRAGVVIGSGIGSLEMMESEHEKILKKAEADYKKHLESTAANIDELYRRGKNSWVKDIVQAVTGV